MRHRVATVVGMALLCLAVVELALASVLTVTGLITGIAGKRRTITFGIHHGPLVVETDAATLVTVRGNERMPSALRLGSRFTVIYPAVRGTNLATEIAVHND